MLLPSVFACPTVGWQSPLRVQATRAVSGPCLPESGGLRPGGSFNHAGLIAFVVRTETAAAEWAPGPGKPCADQRPDPQVSLPAPPPGTEMVQEGGSGRRWGRGVQVGQGIRAGGRAGCPGGCGAHLPPCLRASSSPPPPRRCPESTRRAGGRAPRRGAPGWAVAWRGVPAPPPASPHARAHPRARLRGAPLLLRRSAAAAPRPLPRPWRERGRARVRAPPPYPAPPPPPPPGRTFQRRRPAGPPPWAPPRRAESAPSAHGGRSPGRGRPSAMELGKVVSARPRGPPHRLPPAPRGPLLRETPAAVRPSVPPAPRQGTASRFIPGIGVCIQRNSFPGKFVDSPQVSVSPGVKPGGTRGWVWGGSGSRAPPPSVIRGLVLAVKADTTTPTTTPPVLLQPGPGVAASHTFNLLSPRSSTQLGSGGATSTRSPCPCVPTHDAAVAAPLVHGSSPSPGR